MYLCAYPSTSTSARIAEEATNMRWSFFLNTMSVQVLLLIGFMKTLNEKDKEDKFTCSDNAGKNELLKKEKNEGLNVKFEFTVRETPQQNKKVKSAFATLHGQMQSMMSTAKWDDKRKEQLWMEAAATTTMINERGEPSPHQRFYDESPAFEKNLKIFRQVGVVTLKPGRSINPKLEDCGIKCLFSCLYGK